PPPQTPPKGITAGGLGCAKLHPCARWVAQRCRGKASTPPCRLRYELWAEGSAELWANLGAAAMIYLSGEIADRAKSGAGPIARSFSAESIALQVNRQKLLEIVPRPNTRLYKVSILTDSGHPSWQSERAS
ncbi:hypothetical protein DQ04_08211080, partial [Trypanosoma grayi]|uniref:hypothetical protein n=1 Tax=Trypanosoma grayi TaxID=71804 RepID=UPI0004F46CAF